MRLRRLDLTRYGRFTDHSIAFGPRTDGRPDLHLVYGPNEAGKSTAFRALLDLLYGIEMQSPYDFLHSYATMRIGACLELDGEPRELVRVKNGQTLRDGLGQPVPETLLRGALDGMDRQAYRSMFSLDDDTLESGGESILASKGELGQMLFGASSGVSDLAPALLGLRQDADGFFRPGGHGSELKDLKNQLAALKEQRQGIDTLTSRYRQLVQQLDQLAGQMEAVTGEHRACQQRLQQIRRLLSALPALATLQRQHAALVPLAALSTAPGSWQAELPELQQRIGDATTALALAQAALDDVTGQLGTCIQDPLALALQDGLRAMQELGARHQTAVLDLPRRRQELEAADAAVRACLLRLGRAEEAHPVRLLPDAATAAILRRAISAHAGIAANQVLAMEEHAKACHALRAATQAVGAPTAVVEPAAIEPALHALRDSDHGPRGRDAGRRERQHADALADALAALAPWTGHADVLSVLAVPQEATVRAWQGELGRHLQAADAARAAIDRLEAEAAARAAGTKAAGAGTSPDMTALAALRSAREAGWAELRRRLDLPSADAFEAAMRQDDLAAAARLEGARRLARHEELEQAGLRAAVLRADAQTKLAAALQAAAELQARLDGAVPDIGADGLLPWLGLRLRALERRGDLRQARRDAAEATAESDRLLQVLRTALCQAGIAAEAGTAEALTLVAETALRDAAASKGCRERLADCAAILEQRAQTLQYAHDAQAGWGTRWQAALDRCWLRELGATATPEIVGALLDEVATLAAPLRSRDDLAGRIQAMAADSVAFAAEVARIAAMLDMAGTDSASDQARRITARIDGAVRGARAEEQLRDKARQARATLTKAEIALRGPHQQAAAMFAHLGVDSLLAVGEALGEIDRRDQLLRDVDETGRTLCNLLSLSTVTEAVTTLRDADASALKAEEAALLPQAQMLETRLRTLHADKGKAEDAIAAVGGDDAVARLETQRRLVLLQIEDRALDHLRLRAGVAAAERALRAWREQHRSSMLNAASEAFRVITCGAYRGLGTQPDRNGDILVALPAEGGSKAATALSKGCRFQLYLALRAAGHHEFARLRQPVPFVADDIMETFDDFRAEESLGVFAGMAQVGQVIYLTHHKHLCDLAERKVPGVRIHELLPAA